MSGGIAGRDFRGTTPHLVKKMKFGIFNFFFWGLLNKHPNCIKMNFEGDLTSIIVTRDFFGTATTTLFALTRQGNGCGVDGNHDVGGRGWRLVLMRPMNTMTPFPRQPSRNESLSACAWPAKISFNDVCVVPHKMPSPSMVSFGVTAREKACVELIQWHARSLVELQFNNCMCQGHTECTAGGDGLLSWRVQHKCTGNRGQDVYSQEWEEDRNTPREQERKQRKVRNRRRKGREE